MRFKIRASSAAVLLCGAFLSTVFAEPSRLKVKDVRFTPTPAPSTEMEMVTPYTTSEAIVTLADGTQRTFKLSYVALHRSGDFVGGGYAGLVVDAKGAPILETIRDSRGVSGRGPFMSAGADGMTLLSVPGAGEGTLFLVNHLEYDTEAANTDPGLPPVNLYARLPMALNLTVLKQDGPTGRLTPLSISNVDLSGVGGVWIPCNASTTPWMTHLGSEEYEPDARVFEKKPLEAMNLYLGTAGKLASEGGANPYMYGHITEVTVKPDGKTEVVKHFSMGRLSFELGDVMDDRKTVYFGDDGDDVIRAMYVADEAGDLSAGTLYAAQLAQKDGANFGRFTIVWIRLGHATDAEVRALIDKGTRFSDIWEVAEPAAVSADPGKFKEYRPACAYTGTGGSTALEYLRVKPGMEVAAEFLETRRFAATLGATTEFTKMEGQAHNVADGKLYTVISYIRKGMLDGQNGSRPRDDIRLLGEKEDLDGGAVYESNLRGGQKDLGGEPIASDFVAVDMEPLVTGARQPAGAAAGRFDKCDTGKVANPDNLHYSEAMRALFIGEDSGNHLNNFIWAWNVDSRTAVRIFSSPIGAENTGLNVVDDANGWAYITCSIQHPGAAEDLSGYPELVKTSLRCKTDQRGWVGYLGGLPAMGR
ncbi:MAG: DUF839 domain-containing protein [Planctomycetes bacterium]|nr:DUF839 domain-containing protein [Planctomycetota bacterium]